jgi:sensor histidine kinase regulating citrate/malate metabolism
MKSIKTKMIILGTVAVLLVLLVVSNFVYVSSNETLRYKAQEYATYSKADCANYEENKRILANNPPDGNMQTEVVQVYSPDDIYALDTNRVAPEVKASELAKIKNVNFGALVVAKTVPDDEDVRSALIRHTKDKLTDVIIHQKINVKVGSCLDNPNQMVITIV